jgi:pimeloyl-ACP methyl ester carboxylesterase
LLKKLLKGLSYLLLSLMSVLVLYICVALIAYRDIDPETLEQKYYSQPVQALAVDGVNLRYLDEGLRPQAGVPVPTLLLLHSHYFSMHMWEAWLAPLSEHYRVIRFDMTSHGLTGPDPSNDYSMARSQQLIEALLTELNVDTLSLVGSSLGGNMAFTYAAQHPDKVEKLVLINSGGLKRKDARSGTIPGWVTGIMYLLPEVAFDRFLQWMIADDAVVDAAMVSEFHEMFRRDGNRAAEMNRLRGFDIGDPDQVLAQISAPVLVMWGKDNPQLSWTLSDRFANSLSASSRVEVKVYPNVGHVLPLEIPALAVADVIRFVSGEGVQP